MITIQIPEWLVYIAIGWLVFTTILQLANMWVRKLLLCEEKKLLTLINKLKL